MANLPLPKLKLQLADGTVELPLSAQSAHALSSAIQQLVQSFGERTKTHPKLPMWEQQYREGITLEVFCNPNLWANPLTAKVLVTIKTDQLRCTVELPLSQLRQDLQEYLSRLDA